MELIMGTASIVVIAILAVKYFTKGKDQDQLREFAGKLVMYFLLFCLAVFLFFIVKESILQR
jgi:hypothetical protein